MKITDNDHVILDFGFWIWDLLYRCALSVFIKLTEYLKSEFENPKSEIYEDKSGITYLNVTL
jgi:hypothetical protein